MNNELLSHYQAQWQHHFSDLDAGDWLADLRQQELAIFLENGFPTTKDEQWKYTNLTAMQAQRFELASSHQKTVSAHDVEQFLSKDLPCRLVFVDGFFSPQLSQVTVTAAQLIVTNFAQAIKNQESLLKTYLTDQTSQDAFSNLNTACMQDGVFIYVPANCLVNEPLHVLFLNSGNHQSMQNFRNMIIVESHARVTLIEEHQSLENTAYLTNTVTQIYANEEAKINYTKIQNQNRQSFHIANTTITQKRSSRVDFHSYSLGGQLARENMSCYLNEKGASVLMQGLYLPFKQQHIDVHTCIHHQADHTTSEEYFKGLVAQKSRAVFNGKIVVTEKIKKAVANMQNKNLLVTPDCEVNAKPELEIYADDVKCRHGATIGQIDQEMLFYLRSRGIASEQAYHLLMLAFVAENLSMISCPVVANKVRNLITHYCEELSL